MQILKCSCGNKCSFPNDMSFYDIHKVGEFSFSSIEKEFTCKECDNNCIWPIDK